MTIKEFKDIASGIQSLATVISFIIGGYWVYRKYILQQENYPNIEFLADINLIGRQGDSIIVELISTVENKGKVQHRMKDFKFDLNALYYEDEINTSENWGGQINFPHSVVESSFLPKEYNFFFIDPGVKAKYSYVAKVPNGASFLQYAYCFCSGPYAIIT